LSPRHVTSLRQPLQPPRAPPIRSRHPQAAVSTLCASMSRAFPTLSSIRKYDLTVRISPLPKPSPNYSYAATLEKGSSRGRRKSSCAGCACSRPGVAPRGSTRATHASHPWRLRSKLSALTASCHAQKAGDLPSVANPARRSAPSPVSHAPGKTLFRARLHPTCGFRESLRLESTFGHI
jgi:hypothetical protein